MKIKDFLKPDGSLNRDKIIKRFSALPADEQRDGLMFLLGVIAGASFLKTWGDLMHIGSFCVIEDCEDAFDIRLVAESIRIANDVLIDHFVGLPVEPMTSYDAGLGIS